MFSNIKVKIKLLISKKKIFLHYLSINFSQNNNTNIHITWLRPHEIVDKPELYVDGTSRRDVIQGNRL